MHIISISAESEVLAVTRCVKMGGVWTAEY